MISDDFVRIGTFLDSFGTLTLATNGPAGPWAASLFFARDKQLNLYFISSRHTRHVNDLLETRKVAVTVNSDHKSWKYICGLQISGTAEAVSPNQKSAAVDLYLQKFTELGRSLSTPSTAEERTIAERFRDSEFFRIRPDTIRLIDNAKGFGHTEEFVLNVPASVD